MSLLLAFQNIVEPLPAQVAVGGVALADFQITFAPGTAGITAGGNAPGLELGAVVFDNDADRLTLTTQPTSADSFSICGWVQRGSGTGDPSFFFELDGAGFAWGLSYNGGNLDVTNEFGFGVPIDAGAMAADSWIFVGLTNNAGSGQVFRGDESTAVGTAFTGTLPASVTLTRMNLGASSASANPLTGKLARWRLWNGVQLSQAEFEAERTSVTAVRTSNLAADWKLQGTTSKLVDQSGNGNNLTAAGAGPWQDFAGPIISAGTNLNASPAGVTVGAVAPVLSVDLQASAAGINVGAAAPLLAVQLAVGTAGITVGANSPTPGFPAATAGITVGAAAPVLSVDVSPATAGVIVGAASPVLSVQLQPSTAGVVVGSDAPGLSVSLAVGTAGVQVGAASPLLSVAVSPATAGVTVGAQVPLLSVQLTPATAGITTGAQAPSLTFGGASLAPDAAGVLVGASAPLLTVQLQPGAAGVTAGPVAPGLSVSLTVGVAGVAVGANLPALPVGLLLQPAGAVVGAWTPALLVNLQPSIVGVIVGAWSATAATSTINPDAVGALVGAAAPRLFEGWASPGGGLKRPRGTVSIV